MEKYSIGIDIGSTSAKTVVVDENKNIIFTNLQPTGWSSIETAEGIRKLLIEQGFDPAGAEKVIATGYGRISVPYATKTVTEISCHGRGAVELFGSRDITVIDIGGQDTKVISVVDGSVRDFLMNDKCSAGTGRFLEVMANSLGVSLPTLCEMAEKGGGVKISSMCTVFAESEVISLIGKGESRENIAFAVVNSIIEKVVSQVGRLQGASTNYCLTGGLCDMEYIRASLEKALGHPVVTRPEARFAGGLGAAIR